ncbi:ion channel [Nitratireductor basaltis]|uniref:Potassium channel domain-containing protein n=1 Tax=Nitratireductor basaltis TaxID=472175 RepID=A0A084U650_9HYPH|nr:ion channel [Nitratireductor basaltis]KFB08436.1 hypothetical protein EL18_02687 [Nitratireductor basaltis]
MALLVGFALVLALGVFHHYALRSLDELRLRVRNADMTLIAIFSGLLLIHTLEIVLYAGVYALLLPLEWTGRFDGSFSGSFNDLIYFSGINFSTLGYTQIKTEGSIRIISMMQSLGGFMVLTWSATFVYSAWSEKFSGKGEK